MSADTFRTNGRTNLIRCVSAISVAFAVAASAFAQSDAPLLQLDPGTHWAPARRISISADQRFVATASDDKTVRVWRADSNALVHVLRPPIGVGAKGRLYGAAFHPTRSLIAVGGTSTISGRGRVYFFEPETGELLQTIDTGSGDIKRLVWSPDGRWLLAAFAARGGLKVFSSEGRETSSAVFDGDAYGLDVSNTQEIAATDASGKVHLFRLSEAGLLQRLLSVASPASLPISVSFSPGGRQLAVVHYGLERNGVVDILSVLDGSVVSSIRASVGRGRTQAVQWARAGTRIAIGGARTTALLATSDRVESFRGFVICRTVAAG